MGGRGKGSARLRISPAEGVCAESNRRVRDNAPYIGSVCGAWGEGLRLAWATVMRGEGTPPTSEAEGRCRRR